MKFSQTTLLANALLISQEAHWWRGTIVPPAEKASRYVLQVPNEFAEKIASTFDALGLVVEQVQGQTDTLLLAPADMIEPDAVPQRVMDPVDDGTGDPNPRDVLRNKCIELLDQYDAFHVTVSFSGSGDSGNPDDIIASRAGWARLHDTSNGNAWDSLLSVDLPDEVNEKLSELAWDLVGDNGNDIVNNDGGGGELTFDLQPATAVVLFSMYVNVSSTEQVASDEPV